MRTRAKRIGDVKYKKHFAWLPIKLDGYWVWWEKYTMAYELKEVVHVDEWGHPHAERQWQVVGETI